MNPVIFINGQDATEACLLKGTRITYDSSKRIATANLTIMGETLNSNARYDFAHYDGNTYSLDLQELYLVTIMDGVAGTKLFEGQIYTMDMEQSDGPTFSVWYKCQLNDHASWLDRSVCWGGYTLAMPQSDKSIIQGLLGQFCPRIDPTKDVAQLVPTVQNYDWKTKTCRQVLDDMKALSGGEWWVDFDAVLHYGPANAAPAAPYALSTSPDMVTSFPVKVGGYKHDFNNPINTAYVRGSIDVGTSAPVEAKYSDPVSVGRYGEHAYAVVDEQITTGWDASLRAKSLVLQYAYPVESGNFTVWGYDWLKLGQQVHITEDALGINGNYIVRQLTMQWVDKYTVEYAAQFGASQPDLETILRLLIQRAAWKTSLAVVGQSVPAPGSVTDASIAAPGLTAASIQSVNANTLIGYVTANQIQSVNAGAIVGAVNASQISSVNAGTIQGAVQANQIGSVNATTIQGVVISSQLADGIIDTLSKYATALTPIQMIKIGDPWPPAMPNKNFPPNSFFYYQPDGHFYQVNAAGTSWVMNDNPKNTLMSFYYIGAISANSITGAILAGQIQSITAGQITGLIQAAQIGTVNASSINGQINAGQIASVNASVIQGTISGTQIGSVTAGQITGLLAYNQIGSINASTITIGQLQDTQIAGMSGAKLLVGSVASDKFNGYSIDVGGLANMPGRIRVFDGGGSVVAQLGYLGEVGYGAYGGWFKLFAAGGTSVNDALVKTDAAGNLTVTNATFSVTNPQTGSQLYTGPSYWDSTYSSITLNVEGGGDKTQVITRGVVLSHGAKVGSFVRSPNGNWGAMELLGGSAYTLIDGNAGIRCDGPYLWQGRTIIDNTGYVVGPLKQGAYTGWGGTLSSILIPRGDGTYAAIYVAGGIIVNFVP